MNGYVIWGAVGAAAWVAIVIASRRIRERKFVRGAFLAVSTLGLIVGVLSVAFGFWLASGDRSPIAAMEITEGVMYERFLLDDAVAHLMSFDLANPCLALTTTNVRANGSVDAQKTTSWAREEGAIAAINANYFFPYDSGLPWGDPTPVEGQEVNILGTVKRPGETAVSSESEYGKVRNRLWITPDKTPTIDLDISDDAVAAVTGREQILHAGEVVGHASENYPRTVVGIREGSTEMWWLVVDGKRPGYSVGVTFDEAAEYLLSRGATDAVALDGGGSSTMVVDDGSGVRMLNLTRNQAVPNRERPIANHLGLIRPEGCP